MSKKPLSTKHIEQLKQESGVNEKTALEAGVISLDEKDAKHLIKVGGSGIAFPYYGTDEQLLGYRVKQNNPLKDTDGKLVKYLTAKNSEAFIYFPLKDLPKILASNSLVIIEGEKKLLKFLQEQNECTPPAIAIAGCWMYRKKEQGENELHPVLEEIIKNKNDIIIIPDSDYFQNHKVKSAYNKLAYILFNRGIKVSIVDIRINGVIEKIGVDDFLMRESFLRLQEKIHSPLVTFQNLTANEISNTISAKGVSDKTFETIFNSLAFLDQFQITAKIEAIKSCSKQNQKSLITLFNKSQKAFAFLHNEESPDNYIKYNNKAEGQDILFKKIGKILSGQDYTYLNEDNPNRLIISTADFSKITLANTKTELYDLLGSLFVIELIKTTGGGEDTIATEPLSEKLVSIFFNFIYKYVTCPRVSLISKTPVFVLGKNKLLSNKGFYPNEKIIITESFTPNKHGHPKIKYLLDNIPFKSDVDKENLLGMLLTAIVFKNSLPGAFPSLLIRAQEHGTGKSQLAGSLQFLVEQENPGPINYKTDDELEKHIAAQIQNSSTIIIDNIRANKIDSKALEMLITASVMSFRRLCTQTEIKKVNNTLFILTMNGGAMTSDLISRLVVVELDKSKHHKSRGFNPVEYVKEHRKEIIEEALGLIDECSDLSRSLENYVTRFPKWERLLGNIMISNGYSLFLSNANEMYESIDQELLSILDFVIQNTHQFSNWLTSQEIFKLLIDRKTYNERTTLSPQKIGTILSPKSGKRITFMAYDLLRYECLIDRRRDSGAGGNNYKYLIKISLQRPVTSVALIDESNMNDKIINDDFPHTYSCPPDIENTHDATDSFLEPHQFMIDAKDLFSFTEM